MIFYNDDLPLLEKALQSLKQRVDKLVAIDGPYKNFPHTSITSNQEVLDLVAQYADEVISPKEAWNNQIQKRNAYLIGQPGDYYLMLDADEELVGDLPELTEDYYGIKIKDKRSAEEESNNYALRLFKAKEGLQYKRKHSWLYYKNECVSMDTHNDNIIKLDSPVIIHASYERNEERTKDKQTYYNDRKEPDFLEPLVKDKLSRPIKIKAVLEYHGFDIDSKEIHLKPNEEINVTEKKFKQLMEDFPQDFIQVKE